MKIWIGVTDKAWFDALTRLGPDEVNFWQPSGSRNFRVLQPGEPFLFKLHSPRISSLAVDSSSVTLRFLHILLGRRSGEKTALPISRP